MGWNASTAMTPDCPTELVWRVLETAATGLLVTDPQRCILYANASFTRKTGYTLEDRKCESTCDEKAE